MPFSNLRAPWPVTSPCPQRTPISSARIVLMAASAWPATRAATCKVGSIEFSGEIAEPSLTSS